MRSHVVVVREVLCPRERGNLERVPDRRGANRSIPARAGEPPSAPAEGWQARRSIPARAGEPYDQRVSLAAERVYPRASGGTTSSSPSTGTTLGLSPRERGNPLTSHPRQLLLRSIPARAGEPARAGRCARLCRVYPRASGGVPFLVSWTLRSR